MLALIASVLIFVTGVAIVFLVGKRRPPGTPVTWGEALVAATFVFGLMLLGYGIIPNQWLGYADKELLWRPDRILAAVSAKWPIIHTGTNAAAEAAAGRGRITITYQAIRDIIAAGIYIVMLGLQVALWAIYQKRGRRPAAAGEVERTSIFGRPVVKRA
jgi:hypothetical protein